MDDDLQRQRTLNRQAWGSTLLATGTLFVLLCGALAVLAIVFFIALGTAS